MLINLNITLQPVQNYQQPRNPMSQAQQQTLNSKMEQMELNGQTSPRQPPQTQPQGQQPARGNHYPQMNYQNVCLCACFHKKIVCFYYFECNTPHINSTFILILPFIAI